MKPEIRALGLFHHSFVFFNVLFLSRGSLAGCGCRKQAVSVSDKKGSTIVENTYIIYLFN